MHPLLRYTLDLFGAAPAPETALRRGRPKAKPTPNPVQVKPIKSSEPAALVPQVPLTVPQFAHPQASRQLQLGGVLVAYALARSQRRTIGMVVGPEGLSVRAPRWTPLQEIDAVLQEKAIWIVRKLLETQERRSQQQERQLVWAQGACFPFLGQTLSVRLAESGGATRLGDAGADMVRPLHLPLPATASPTQIRCAVRDWLMVQAQQIFVQRLDHFAPLLQVRWKQLALSNAATRWGSARSDGSIRLNWRLVHFELPVLDYVVAHELSHLRVMNHSPRFWETVRSVVPDYVTLRARLKDEAVPRW